MPDDLTHDQRMDLAVRTGRAHDRTGDVAYEAVVHSRASWVEGHGPAFTQEEALSFANTISGAVVQERNLTSMFHRAAQQTDWLGQQGMNAAYTTAAGRDVIEGAVVGGAAGGVATSWIAGVGALGGAAFGGSALAANAAGENAAAERFLRELEERGVNVGNRADLARALQNPAIMGPVMREVNTGQGISLTTNLAASAAPGSLLMNSTIANGVDGGAQALLDGSNVAQVTHATIRGATEGAASAIPGGRGVGASLDVALRL